MARKTDQTEITTLGRSPQLPSRVAAAIASEIVGGRLKEGDRLPTEEALASKFGVSRSVVREAIAHLRSNGVVHSRQGVGMFVAKPSETTVLRIDADMLNDRLVFSNVFELRAILEIKAAALAAFRADKKQLKEIAGALSRMMNAKNWSEDGVTADLDFHQAVAVASGNSYMGVVVGFLSGQMRQSIMFMRQNQSDMDGTLVATNIAEHSAIYEAIRERSPARAVAAMRNHITNAAMRLGYELSRGALEFDDSTP